MSIRIGLGKAKKAPTEFLIWAIGTIETTKGTFELKDAQAIVDRAKEYGNALSFDYNHGVMDSGERAKGAGTFVPEARKDGLWATQIEWTANAKAGIEAGEWLYFSPLFEYDENGCVTELHNIALVNMPATKNMRRLAAKKGLAAMDPEQEKMKEKEGAPVADPEALKAAYVSALEALVSAKDACVAAGVEIEVEPSEGAADTDPAPPMAPEDKKKEGLSKFESTVKSAYPGKTETEIVAAIFAASLTAETTGKKQAIADVDALIATGKVQAKRKGELLALREKNPEAFALLSKMLPTPAKGAGAGPVSLSLVQPVLNEDGVSLAALSDETAFWQKTIGGFSAEQFENAKKKVSK